MSDSVLAVLKICFLAVLYLFLARVLRAVWVEIRDDGRAATPSTASTAPRRQPRPDASRRAKKAERARPARLVVVEPPEQRGTAFALAEEVTVGRSTGSAVRVDDTFASQLHARVFQRDGEWFVEDLGSTNGTFLNRKRVNGPVPLRKGDRLQVGQTVLELRRDG